MDDQCTICGTAYGIGRDDADRPWRTLCRCEQGFRCVYGGHSANHAREDEKGLKYLCDKHGVPLETRAEQALLPPDPEPLRQRASSRVSGAAERPPKSPKPPKAPPPPPPVQRFTGAELAAVFANYTELVRCQCGDEHPFNTRTWRDGEFIETNQTSTFGKGFHPSQHHCPKCDLPNVHPETGHTTFTNMREEAPVVHRPASKGKR